MLFTLVIVLDCAQSSENYQRHFVNREDTASISWQSPYRLPDISYVYPSSTVYAVYTVYPCLP